MKKKWKYRLFSIFLSLLMIARLPLLSFNSYADSVSTYDPSLVPIFTMIYALAVGSGIVAKSGGEALTNLVNDAVSQIKASEVAKATSDNTYNSPYRVINSQGEPEKPNNNNKNGKWFAIAGASALTGALMFEKGAAEDVMETLYNLGAYKPMQGSIGILSADSFKTQCSASNVALQLADFGNSSVTQFDQFLHSAWWNDKDFTPDDCYYLVNVNVTDIIANEPKYPNLYISIVPKKYVTDLSFVDISGSLTPYTYSNLYGSLSYYYSSNVKFRLINTDNIAYYFNNYQVNVQSRNANEAFSYTVGYSNLSYFSPMSNGTPTRGYCGYRFQVPTQWQFTQNVYQQGTQFDSNFPDWLQEQFQLLNENVQGIRVGLPSLDPSNWTAQNATQPQIQEGLSPDNAVIQAINNWLNPENAPDPDPDPDPDPEPSPDPIPEPAPDDSYLENFLLPSSITTKFPFCIPFDIAHCLQLFSGSSRSAPRWECDLHYGSQSSHIVIDLSIFDDVASLIRPIEFIVFLVGLAYATRYLIKG